MCLLHCATIVMKSEHPQDVQAVLIVRLIDELFAIDPEARMANLDHAARHILRSKKAPALLEEIKAAVTATYDSQPTGASVVQRAVSFIEGKN